MNILTISNLTKIYKGGAGIKDINLSLGYGEIMGLLGPNGAGKTTIMKVLAGFVRKDSGEIRVYNMDHEKNFEKILHKTSFIIENVQSYGYMSAYKNLQQIARFYPKIDESRILEVLELVELSKVKDKKVSSFSLGMKQRLGLAGAMVSRPELIILDEPFNSLDIDGVVQMKSIIKELSKSCNTAFLISSHQVFDMQSLCDTISVIQNGKITCTDSIIDINRHYSNLEEYYLKKTSSVKEALKYA